jgi:transposase InsO family protein
MNTKIHPQALFRLSVLGLLTCRGQLTHGELKTIIRELAAQNYVIPDSNRSRLSEQTIRRWYYAWQRGGITKLMPCIRQDKGKSHLEPKIQEALITAKQDNPSRSINTLIYLCEAQGIVSKGTLSRASVHRFLKQKALSKRIPADRQTIERRAFVAEHAGQLSHGDVLHGPSIQTPQGLRKVYLVSLIDDASRLVTHNAFCFGETALDIEGVLKQAILKRGLPYKLIIDNGSAYISHSLQSICALLEIKLIYCRAGEPEAKGKIERYHRTFREHFLDELNLDMISCLDDLNARLWAWTEQVYNQRDHEGLKDQTPIERWREDLVHIRPLGLKASQLDHIFHHRYKRTVRKDGTVRWNSKIFEVPYELSGKNIILVVDPHTEKAIYVESLIGEDLGPVTELDRIANNFRKRQRPTGSQEPRKKPKLSAVEFAFKEYSNSFGIPSTTTLEDE